MNASSHVQAAQRAAAKVAAEKEAAEQAAAEEAATRMESQAAADNFQKQLKQAAQVRHPYRYSHVATEIAFVGPFLQPRAYGAEVGERIQHLRRPLPPRHPNVHVHARCRRTRSSARAWRRTPSSCAAQPSRRAAPRKCGMWWN